MRFGGNTEAYQRVNPARLAVQFPTITLCLAGVLIESLVDGPIAQFRLERTPDKREVTGSSPVRPTISDGR